MSLRIAAYLRVSTEEQAEVVEGSLDNQKYRITEFVRARTIEKKDWGKIVDFYIDDGYSAKDTRRPAYQRMMADIKKGKVNLILVTDLSRLSRNIQDFSNLLSYLDGYKSKFLSMKEQFDTSTPAGKMMIFNMINLAQFEREQTSERVALNCHARAMRGLANGGKAILGLEHNPEEPGTFKINDSEAEMVKIIFQKFLEFGSRGKTIQFLYQAQIYPKSHREKNQDARPRRWTVQSLGDTLSHAAYIGMKEVNRLRKREDQGELKAWQKYKMVKATWPAIIDRDTFDRAQILLSETANYLRQRKAKSPNRMFLLSGILVCGECGRPLMGQTSHGRTSVHRYYVHNQHSKDHQCAIQRYKADEMEDLVIKHIVTGLKEAGYFTNLNDRIKQAARSGNSNATSDIKRVKTALSDLEKQIAQIWQIQSRGQLTQDALQIISDDLNRLALEKKVLKEYLENLESAKVDQEEIREQSESLSERLREFEKGWAKAAPSLRKILLKRVIKNLVTLKDGIQIVYRLNDGLDGKRNQGIGLGNLEKSENVIEAGDRLSGNQSLGKSWDGKVFGSLKVRSGRGDRIRTCDPLVPNQMRYQTALLPDEGRRIVSFGELCQTDRK